MQSVNLVSFTVGGLSSGNIALPCMPNKSVPIEVELKGVLSAKEAPGPVNVPIWIGEHHLFWNTTLIDSYVAFSGPAGQSITAIASFSLHCSNACDLTPTGTTPPSSAKVPPWLQGMAPWIISIGMFTVWTVLKTWHWLFPWFWKGKFTRYYVDGKKMTISCAYYESGNVPFFRWWYGNQKVTVVCGGDLPE